MTTPFASFAPRLLAGIGTAALVAAVGLFASSRPAHTAGGPIPVTVSNSSLNVTDADNPARQPFAHTSYLSLPVGTAFVNDSIPVPAGKRLVIEYVEVFSSDTVVDALNIRTISSGGTAYWHLTDFTTNSSGFVEASQAVRWYASGFPLAVVVTRPTTLTAGTVLVSISGYYVNIS